MPKKELQELIRRDRDRTVKSTREAGWSNATFVRRPLRPATAKDRVMIFVFVFLSSAIATWAGYWYLLSQAVRRHNEEAVVSLYEPIQGGQMLLICAVGGLIGVIIYAVISVADPYGTEAAEQREAKRQKDREEMLAEIRATKFPQGTEHEQAIRRLAEMEQAQAAGAQSESENGNHSV
jgi:hypothetical protein